VCVCVCVCSGVVLEGFLRFPEATQDVSLDDGHTFFSYKMSQGLHSVLNSGATVESKLRKASNDLFLVATKENWRLL